MQASLFGLALDLRLVFLLRFYIPLRLELPRLPSSRATPIESPGFQVRCSSCDPSDSDRTKHCAALASWRFAPESPFQICAPSRSSPMPPAPSAWMASPVSATPPVQAIFLAACGGCEQPWRLTHSERVLRILRG